MKMKIVAAEPLKKQTLEADHEGISYHQSGGFGMGDTSHHTFAEIDAVVRNTSNPSQPVLSIQCGTSIYSIRYKANDQGHRALIDHIVANAQKTVAPSQETP